MFNVDEAKGTGRFRRGKIGHETFVGVVGVVTLPLAMASNVASSTWAEHIGPTMPGAIESLNSAVFADGLLATEHESSLTDFIGQELAQLEFLHGQSGHGFVCGALEICPWGTSCPSTLAVPRGGFSRDLWL